MHHQECIRFNASRYFSRRETESGKTIKEKVRYMITAAFSNQ